MEGFNWGVFDFIIGFSLIFVTALVFYFVSKKLKILKHKVVLGIGLLAILLVVWVELAVGIFN